MSVSISREKAVFYAALDVADPAQRRQFLDQACADDAELRVAVEELLAVHADSEQFFDDCASSVMTMPADELESAAALTAELCGPVFEEKPGTIIGRYKLVQKIGEGGCGLVYLAEQEQPVRRQVALKVIKLGMDTRNVIARFEAERQALAMMNHPNIARVLDAGATDAGRPYFVMEMVNGVRITEYCDQNRLGLEQRLELFIQVCHAIQHAHQKGIIHRDIKPSNVLVTMLDGVPRPKVIDFGIAKATDEQLTDKTLLFTAYAQLIGTPAYMSPEQMELGGLDLDTRSDIYSLGVLLYELLTGRTPFDSKELLKSGVEAMRRTLREQDPPRPSAKLDGMRVEELAQTAVHRRVEPARFKLVLRGDLDWIVMKAMEKDRNRRYQTAIGLGVDVRHYLNHEPVVARPPSNWYRLQKLVRRNRAVFISIAAVSLALIAGFGTSTWLFIKEREARLQEQEARREAQKNEALLRRQAEVREVIAKASSLVDKFQLTEADKLVGALPSSDTAMAGAAVFRPLGDWAAVQGNWRRAAEYYSILIPLDLFKNVDSTTLDYTKYAVVLVEMGDRPAYENLCRDSIKQFGKTTDPLAAEHILKNSLLIPPDASLLAALVPLAEVAVKSVPANVNPALNYWRLPWRCMSLALMEYRRGNYAEAVNWGNRCLSFKQHDADNVPRVATVRTILAMSYHQLGQAEPSRSELATSRELIEERSKTAFFIYQDGHGMWFDWFVARILEREAAAMIESPAPATK